MHFEMALAVEADDADGAHSACHDFLVDFEGSVFDWYEFLDSKPPLCAAADEEAFLREVFWYISLRDHAKTRLLQHFGRPVDPPVDPDSELANYWPPLAPTEWYQHNAAAFTALLNDRLLDVEDEERLGGLMMQVGEIMHGRFGPLIKFYDTVGYSRFDTELSMRVMVEPERQWLVPLTIRR